MRGPHWLLASYLKRTRNGKSRLYLGLIDCNWNLCYFLRMIKLQGPLAFQQAENHTEWCAHLRWISLPEAGAILVTWWNASPPLGVVSKPGAPKCTNERTVIQKDPTPLWYWCSQTCTTLRWFPSQRKTHKENNPYPCSSTSWTWYISASPNPTFDNCRLFPITTPPVNPCWAPQSPSWALQECWDWVSMRSHPLHRQSWCHPPWHLPDGWKHQAGQGISTCHTGVSYIYMLLKIDQYNLR